MPLWYFRGDTMKHVKAFFADGSYISAWWFPSQKTVMVWYSDMDNYMEQWNMDRATLPEFVQSMYRYERVQVMA
jgi:hypothetical protein